MDSKLEFMFPKIKEDYLDNGAKIVLVTRDDLPIIEMEIMFNGGYAIENENNLGLVNFTMSMLDEGTKKYSVFGYEDLKSELGSSISFGSSLDNSYASLSSLKINFDKTLDLLYESCLLYTSPSPRDATLSRMPSSA